MRKFILLCIILAACEQPSKTVQQQIFEDYLLIHFNSWSDAMARNYVPELDLKIGDTIRLVSELGMLIIPCDTTTEIPLKYENSLTLDSGTMINISSDENKFTFEVQVAIEDTTYMGIIWIDQYLNAQWGEDNLNRSRKGLVEHLARLKKEGIRELSRRYELSEDSIHTLISYEYFERTGRRGMNY